MPAQKSTAKDVFSYLLMIGTLYAAIASFLTFVFQFVNVQFPDVLSYSLAGPLDMMRSAIAVMIIVWPVTLLMSWSIDRDIRGDHSKKDLWVRKWLLYLTLFIAAIVTIVDLISLINVFLSGEITTRFALKVLAVLVVAVGVFSYYLWDLRRDPSQPSRIPLVSGVVGSVVIIGFIVAGFFVIGTPATQREIRLDETRVNDLQTLQSRVVEYWQTKGALPQTQENLKNSLSGLSLPVDPETGTQYEYLVTGDLAFSLCANFAHDSITNAPNINQPIYAGLKVGNDFWTHGSGRVCFDRSIDPDFYPVAPGKVGP